MSSNKISSLAGLDGCPNLRTLNMMDNKVSRIGSNPFFSFKLQILDRLSLSMNTEMHQEVNVGLRQSESSCLTGSLVGLKKLQYLNLAANQLISTRGLSLVNSLISLDLSSNHLTSLDEMESLALLQVLNVSRNTIQEVRVN